MPHIYAAFHLGFHCWQKYQSNVFHSKNGSFYLSSPDNYLKLRIMGPPHAFKVKIMFP